MTHEIIHRSRRDAARGGTLKIINQYEFRLKVGKGQHGEVYLAEDSTKDYMQVVSVIPIGLPFPLSALWTRCV